MAQQLSSSAGGNAPMETRQAEGAQIPMQDFSLPQFPREAGGLMALTLTSDIKLDEYSDILQKPFKVTHLPPSIQSLTLELFSLGYPAGFLKDLIKELPELRSLVLYSQLFAGVSSESRDDAIAFFEGAKKLRALHLLDVFAQPGFVLKIAPVLKKLEKPLMFLEVNYTNQPQDEKFLDRIPSEELALLISPGLISCSLNIAPPENTNDPDDPTNIVANDDLPRDGIQTVDTKNNDALVKALLDEETAPRALKLLNTTLYSLSTCQLRQLIAKHHGVMVLSATVQVDHKETWKASLLEALSATETLEQVEIVLNPSSEGGDADISIEQKDLTSLSSKCKKLNNFKVNTLRKISKVSVEWAKAGAEWKETITEAKIQETTKPNKQENWSPWT